MQYRILTSEDMALYREIRLECLKENPDYFGTEYQSEVQATTLKFDKALQQYSKGNFMYGAFDENTIVGICGFTAGDRNKTKHRGDISQLYVRKSHTGNGIGRQLLLHTLQNALSEQTVEVITLSVVDSNIGAIALYKSIGFVQYSFLPNYFKNNNISWGIIGMVITNNEYQQLYTTPMQ